MTLPNTPLPSAGQLVGRLEGLYSDLDTMRNEVEQTGEELKDAKREFEFKKAEVRLEQTGTVQGREDKTVTKLWKSNEYKRFVNAETKRDVLKTVERLIDTQASIAQSELKAMDKESYR